MEKKQGEMTFQLESGEASKQPCACLREEAAEREGGKACLGIRPVSQWQRDRKKERKELHFLALELRMSGASLVVLHGVAL